jgi:hypothetical protein
MSPMKDGTGPLGQGPMGRGRGPCGGGQRRGWSSGRGQGGQGRGQGFGRGRGQGGMMQQTLDKIQQRLSQLASNEARDQSDKPGGEA